MTIFNLLYLISGILIGFGLGVYAYIYLIKGEK